MHTDALNYWHVSVVIFEGIKLHVLSRQKIMLGEVQTNVKYV